MELQVALRRFDYYADTWVATSELNAAAFRYTVSPFRDRNVSPRISLLRMSARRFSSGVVRY